MPSLYTRPLPSARQHPPKDMGRDAEWREISQGIKPEVELELHLDPKPNHLVSETERFLWFRRFAGVQTPSHRESSDRTPKTFEVSGLAVNKDAINLRL